MREDLVSIIIPAYNAEKYLDRCLQSLMTQTYQKMEILVVDDGSTDRTRDIVLKYAKEDVRVKYIFQKNCGVSAARNFGMKKAQGKYIIFSDADDYAEPVLVQREIEQMESCDGAFFEYIYEASDGAKQKSEKVIEYGIYKGERLLEIISNMCGGGKYYSSIWRAVYCRELIQKNQLKFRNIKFAEDMLFNIEYILCSTSVYISPQAYYHYCEQEQSALKKIQYDIRYTIDEIREENKLFLKYPNRGLEKVYAGQIDISCRRLLDITLKYRTFRKAAVQLQLIENAENIFPENKTINYLTKKQYFRLYVFLWKDKIRRKLFS